MARLVPVVVACVVLASLSASSTATPSSSTLDQFSTFADTLVDTLASLTFLHTGVVRASDNLTFLHICNGFSEDGPRWTSFDPTRSYLYNVTSDGTPTAPAMGLRSAVPLGGIGTGSFELRADGTFADWTVENQGTPLAADASRNSKLPLKDEAFLAVAIGGQGPLLLRTAPPPDPLPAAARADSLAYSGAFPFSRLTVEDARLPPALHAQLFAFSPFSPFVTGGAAANESAIPAVLFSLRLTNPSSLVPLNASLLLSLPLGNSKSTDRPFGNGGDTRGQLLATLNDTTVGSCVAACASVNDCLWWRHSGSGDVCELFRLAPPVEQYFLPSSALAGIRTGVKGLWASSPGGLTLTRSGPFDSDPNATWQDPASAVGSFTLLAADTVTNGGLNPATSSAWTGEDLSELWASFSSGGLGSGLSRLPTTSASHGAVAVSTVLAPSETRTLTLVFSWHFPHRLYVGQDLGNAYAQRFPGGSAEVAASVATRLPAVAADAAAWNAAATNNTLPDWYRDYLVNSVAFLTKMSVWVANDVSGAPVDGGRFRIFEAFSNCDLDPVHVSSYHLLPLLTFFPDLLANTLHTGWAARQQTVDGMVQEFLGDVGDGGRITGEMDLSSGGGVNADVSSVFVLASLGTFQMTGDVEALSALYPNISAAVAWQINRTIAGPNASFPAYLQITYDFLNLEQYPYQAYTAFLHLAMMRAFRVLAAVVGDTSSLPADALASAQAVEGAMASALWVGPNATANTTSGFWRAWQDMSGGAPDAAMSGTLHGQTWAYVLGLGPLVDDQSALLGHIRAELAQNCAYDPSGTCSLGLQTLAHAPKESAWSIDSTPAQNFDTAAVAIFLGEPLIPTTSPLVAPARAVVGLYREQTLDMWNWHDLHLGPAGLTCNGSPDVQGPSLAGTPFVNAHYARQVQGWAIQRGVVGQMWDAASRVLRLALPIVRAGVDRFPVLLPGLAATLSVDGDGATARLRVLRGRLAGSATVNLRIGRLILQGGGEEWEGVGNTTSVKELGGRGRAGPEAEAEIVIHLKKKGGKGRLKYREN
jgi:uncharacterized protein (DUF608 family)